MSLSLGMVTIDCVDPQSLAQFWAETLGTSVAADYGQYVMLVPAVPGQPPWDCSECPSSASVRTGCTWILVPMTERRRWPG